METQTLYHEAMIFAAQKHQEKEQKVPGTDLPYVVHLSNVAMEIMMAAFNSSYFNLGFTLQVALLHDTIEDTSTSFEELEDRFGSDIAKAVLALTKNSDLPKDQQMPDTLKRIKKLSTEVWAIKLADRITNLQAPPLDWNKEKKIDYKKEAIIILSELKGGNPYLEKRLEEKIEEYEQYVNS